jgi:hypothetical protein
MKLISMTDFVISQWDKDITREDFAQSMIKCATFLKQPLQLFMFVPCDELGNVLEKPVMFYSDENIKYLKGIEIEVANECNKKVKQYQQAKERCLFEGFEFEDRTTFTVCVEYKNITMFFTYRGSVNINGSSVRYIEDLVTYELSLTPTAIKQIGL